MCERQIAASWRLFSLIFQWGDNKMTQNKMRKIFLKCCKSRNIVRWSSLNLQEWIAQRINKQTNEKKKTETKWNNINHSNDDECKNKTHAHNPNRISEMKRKEKNLLPEF